MKVLMFSIDKGLLGKGQLGDVVERHRRYGELADKLDIIVFCRQGFSENQISDKVTVFPTNSKSRLNYFFNGLSLAKKLFIKNQYDLIVTQEPFITSLVGYCLKTLISPFVKGGIRGIFKTKLLIHFHGDFFSPQWLAEKPINKVLLILGKFLARRADGIRAVSSGIKESLVKIGVAPEKIKVISTPINLEKFQKVDAILLEEFKVKNKLEGKKLILNVGRRDPAKDYSTLFKGISLVFEKRKDIILALIGSGFVEEELKNCLPENLPKILTGRIGQDFVNLLYHLSSLYVSSSSHESFGKVLVEANAAGLPVVSTATTGTKEIVQDGYNGFLVPIGDAKALAEKVLYLLDHPQEAKEMGEHGKQLVWEKFSGQANTQKIINFWQDVVAGKL
jgi:glycosyltransferase involved in cell wall biosynthesis